MCEILYEYLRSISHVSLISRGKEVRPAHIRRQVMYFNFYGSVGGCARR